MFLAGNMLTSFADELTKLAAKVPFVHGTFARHPVLKAGVGRAVLKNDPNPRAVYVGMKNRAKTKSVRGFAADSVKSRGGKPLVAHGKIDTEKGWAPAQLTAWGKKNIGGIDDARDLVDELATAKGARRGEIWRMLQKGTGQWRNDNLATSLRPSKYKS
jgi:hypothetical protein